MRCLVPIALIAALLPAEVLAQTPSTAPPEGPITTSKINITAEQRFIIRENVLGQQHPSNPNAPSPWKPGSAVPADVEVRALPALVGDKVPQVRSYSYFVKDNRIVLVDPQDNKIVEVID